MFKLRRLNRPQAISLSVLFTLLFNIISPLTLFVAKAQVAYTPVPGDSMFVGSPKYVRENNAGDLAAQVHVINLTSDVRFYLNGTGPIAGTYSGVVNGTLNRWRLYTPIAAGEYTVTAEYEVNSSWYPVTGDAKVYSLDLPYLNYIIPTTTNNTFRPSDNPVRIKTDDEFNQFESVEFRLYNYDIGTSTLGSLVNTVTTYRAACDLRQEGNYVLCDIASAVGWSTLSAGAYKVNVQTDTLANNGVRYIHNQYSDYFIIDDTRPVINSFETVPAGQTLISSSVDVLANATDNVEVDNVEFYVRTPRSDGQCVDNDGAGVAIRNVTVLNDGDDSYPATLDTSGLDGYYCLFAKAKDTAASHSNPASSIKVMLDNTAPDVPTGVGFNVSPGDYTIEPVEVACGGSTNVNAISIHWTDESASGAISYERQWKYPNHTTWGGPDTWTNHYTNYRSFGGGGGVQGEWNYRVRAIDTAGNLSAWSDACSILYDREAPTTALTSPSNDSSWNGAIPITGNTSDTFNVDFVKLAYADYDGSTCGSFSDFDTLDNDSNSNYFEFDTTWTPSADGAYCIKAYGTDLAGNEEHSAIVMGIVFDTTAPAAPSFISVFDRDTSAEIGCGGYTNNPRVKFTWNLNSEPDIAGYWFGTQFNDHHEYFADPTDFKNATMTPGHNPYWYTLIAVDTAGNESVKSATCDLILDMELPYSAFTGPEEDSFWNSPIELTGVSEDNYDVAFVDLYYGDHDADTWTHLTQLVNPVDGSPFNWSYSWTPAEGTYDFKAVATDGAGNVESTAYLDNITYDVTAPTIPTGLQFIESVSGDAISCGGFTNESIHYPDWDDNTDDTDHYDYTSFWGTDGHIGIRQELTDSIFIHSWDSPEGTFGYKVRAVDEAGNKSEWALAPDVEEYDSSCKITVDYTNPIVDITSHENGDILHGTENLLGDIIETNPDHYNLALYPTSGGVCDPEATWNFGARLWQVTAGGNSVDHNLDTTAYSDGLYMLRLAARDAAGNRDPMTNTGTGVSVEVICVTIDNTGPEAPVIIFPNEGDVFSTQPILNDWTDATDPSGIDFYRIQYEYDDGHTFSGYPYRTTTASERNHVPALWEEGGVKFRVQAFDNVGNEGDWSEWRHYYYDHTPPVVTVTSHTEGQVVNGNITVTGTIDDEHNHHYWFVVQNAGGTQVAGPGVVNNTNDHINASFSWDTELVDDGMYTIKLEARDAAGNKEPDAAPVLNDPENPTDSVDWVTIEVDNYGFIQGRKFNDVNGNGVFDIAEKDAVGNPNRLDNWTIVLYDNAWTEIDRMQTGDDGTEAGNVGKGQYRFVGLLTGTYYVCEELQDGWMQTRPTNDNYLNPEDESRCFRVILSPGQERQGVEFGNFEYASINGYKWNDIDQDGSWDAGEPGLENWTISMRKLEELRIEADALLPLSFIGTVITDADGYYEFDELSIGTYEICEELKAGWVQTYPVSPECHLVEVTESGQIIADVNFGNYEDFTPTVTVGVSATSTVEQAITFTATITDQGNAPASITSWSGNFAACTGTSNTVVTPSTPGTYTCGVTVTDLDGDTATDSKTVTVNSAPAEGAAPATTNPQVLGTNTNLGNVFLSTAQGNEETQPEENADKDEQEGEVLGTQDCEQTSKASGFVYVDKNDNSTMDGDDQGIENAKIKIYQEIDGSLELVSETTTDDNGYWQANLCPGSYEIKIDKDSLGDDYSVAEGEDVRGISINATGDTDDINFGVTEEGGFNYWLIFIPLAILLLLGLLGYYVMRDKEE